MRHLQLFRILGVIVLLATGCKRPEPFDFSSQEVERIQLPGAQGIVSSTTKLKAGALYSVLVYGAIHFASDDLASLDAQHKYSLKNRAWEGNKSLLINGVPAVAGQKNDTYPFAYIFYMSGAGEINDSQVATFKIDDDKFDDNWGQLDIRIYRGYIDIFPPDVPTISVHRNPVKITVDANQGWQPTRIQIKAGDSFRVISVTGVITDGKESFANGIGLRGTCSSYPECCGPLPNSPRSGLIARVGEANPVFIGNGSPNHDIPASTTGELQFSVNDCPDGLMDNAGTLTVEVLPK